MKMKQVYQHREAFCLMLYRSEDGLEEELIWNSRDGVTPFAVSSRDGERMLNHVDWHKDRRIPDFAPPPGSRYFASITEEEARQRAEARVDHVIAENNQTLPTMYGSKQELVDRFAAQYRIGESPIVKTAGQSQPLEAKDNGQ
jgi:hypothetical protein